MFEGNRNAQSPARKAPTRRIRDCAGDARGSGTQDAGRYRALSQPRPRIPTPSASTRRTGTYSGCTTSARATAMKCFTSARPFRVPSTTFASSRSMPTPSSLPSGGNQATRSCVVCAVSSQKTRISGLRASVASLLAILRRARSLNACTAGLQTLT